MAQRSIGGAVIGGGIGIKMTVIGSEAAALKMKGLRNRIKRARTTGVDRVGRYLLKKKKEDCKQGLYSGRETAPNKWRFGWEYLGGPAVTHFTGATLKAHKLGKRVNANTDRIEVFIDPVVAPHASIIHGNIKGNTEYFENRMLRMLVRTRPWMKITQEERGEAVKIIKFTYQGRF